MKNEFNFLEKKQPNKNVTHVAREEISIQGILDILVGYIFKLFLKYTHE